MQYIKTYEQFLNEATFTDEDGFIISDVVEMLPKELRNIGYSGDLDEFVDGLVTNQYANLFYVRPLLKDPRINPVWKGTDGMMHSKRTDKMQNPLLNPVEIRGKEYARCYVASRVRFPFKADYYKRSDALADRNGVAHIERHDTAHFESVIPNFLSKHLDGNYHFRIAMPKTIETVTFLYFPPAEGETGEGEYRIIDDKVLYDWTWLREKEKSVSSNQVEFKDFLANRTVAITSGKKSIRMNDFLEFVPKEVADEIIKHSLDTNFERLKAAMEADNAKILSGRVDDVTKH